MTMEEELRMRATFEKIGNEFGFKTVSAEYRQFTDCKVKWIRSYDWIQLRVSDYFEGAPEEIVEKVAGFIFSKIRGKGDARYPEKVVKHLTSDSFLERNQPKYIRRCRNLRFNPGNVIDLQESYRRLIDRGLTEDDPWLRIGWSVGKSLDPGRSSTLMRVVQITDELDDGNVSENALDYALYLNVAKVDMGFDPGNGNREEEYKARLDRYPGREDAKRELRGLGFRV